MAFWKPFVFKPTSIDPNTIYLKLIASLLKTLHYPSCCLRLPAFNDFLRESYCASVMMTTSAGIMQRMQKSVKDDSSSDHLKAII